jgi:predicted nucleotidyltransferase
MSLNKLPFGLRKNHVDNIIDILRAHPEVERAAIFGSRALGTYKKGSDVDLVLYGDIRDEIITAISYKLNEEGTLPYFFDVLSYNSIDNPALKEHIDRVGIIFYSKDRIVK